MRLRSSFRDLLVGESSISTPRNFLRHVVVRSEQRNGVFLISSKGVNLETPRRACRSSLVRLEVYMLSPTVKISESLPRKTLTLLVLRGPADHARRGRRGGFRRRGSSSGVAARLLLGGRVERSVCRLSALHEQDLGSIRVAGLG